MKLKENLYLFVIAIFISFFIWYGLTYSNLAKEERWEKVVPLKIEVPNKLVLKGLKPSEIKIFGKGYKPKDEEVSIVIPIEKTKEGHFKINISKEVIKIPQNSEIYKIEPTQVDIELEAKIVKEVPFVLPKEISRYYKISIEPKHAKLSGAESIMIKQDEFKVPSFQIPEKLPANILLPLTSPSKEIELLSPMVVEIKIEGLKK